MLSLEVQRTIKRVEFTAFSRFFRKVIGPSKVHVDTKVLFMGCGGEKRCIGPRAKDADLWILTWEELHRIHQEGILVEVEHVKAHRSTKGMQKMSFFEKVHRRRQ